MFVSLLKVRNQYWKGICIAVMVGAASIVASPAQTFTTLARFDEYDGYFPTGSLVQGADGNLYGTTQGSNTGTSDGGTIFSIAPGGTLNTLYYFCSDAGCNFEPIAGMTLATDGNFYGTTAEGLTCGAGCNSGAVFRMAPGGTPITLYTFCGQTNCTDGSYPYGGLVQATDGNFYGTTYGGGDNNLGTVFRITPVGTLTTLHSFTEAEAGNPTAALVQGTDGDLYGVTGGLGAGIVFKITLEGTFSTLYTGLQLYSALIQATDGDFYGTSVSGGQNREGTVFKITPHGKFTTLYTFCAKTNCADGYYPFGGLVQATDGNFYGTTREGGNPKKCNTEIGTCGTIFRITPKGKLTTLYDFTAAGGAEPYDSLIQATDGSFYGTAGFGGDLTSIGCTSNGCGAVFGFSLGLAPFIKTLPISGKVGTAVTILGQNLTGTASVTFNGTPAAFTVVSDTEITTTVPVGATTGPVVAGALSSNVVFRVTPMILRFSPRSGPVGTIVAITGQSFTGATSVTFGGVKASFTVNSDTQITATVPTGAKTGKITVTTPGGKATSPRAFTVN
jgi:uncharacterized repeat protein (TIGR03803 family)